MWVQGTCCLSVLLIYERHLGKKELKQLWFEVRNRLLVCFRWCQKLLSPIFYSIEKILSWIALGLDIRSISKIISQGINVKEHTISPSSCGTRTFISDDLLVIISTLRESRLKYTWQPSVSIFRAYSFTIDYLDYH